MRIPVRSNNRSVLITALFVLSLTGALVWSGNTSANMPQSDGLFTARQAARGAAAYAKSCASCHGANLEGTSSLPLKGPGFTNKWADGKHTVDDLYFITRNQMPYGAPGTLTDQQYIDIVALMLQKSGYRAGSKELTTNPTLLKSITISVQTGSGRPEIASKVDAAAPVSSPARPVNGKPSQAELNAAGNTTDWLMSNHDYGGQRFTDLKQITRQNVGSLKPVATYEAGDRTAFHTNPVVSGGVMYVTVSDSTIALDAGTLKLKWRNDRQPKGKQGWPMNRGVAIKDGLVVRGTHDGYLVAIDAATGKIAWERALVDMTKHEGGFTMAPMIFEDLIIIGPAGSELGVKGWVGAFRLSNGEQVWRFNTVPDDGEPGSETWEKPDAKLIGGGAVWAPLSLDVAERVVYVPVANPAPDFFGEARPGANLYTCSMIALDVRTGKLKWFYQLVPHDEHDWDTTQVSPLFSTTIGAKLASSSPHRAKMVYCTCWIVKHASRSTKSRLPPGSM